MSKKTIIAALLVISLLFAASPRTAAEWLKKGAEQQKQAQFDKAIESIKNALYLDTTSVTANKQLAYVYFNAYKYTDKQLRKYNENPMLAARNSSNDLKAALSGQYQNMTLSKMLVLIDKRDFYKEKCISSFNRLLVLNPKLGEAYVAQATIEMIDGNLEKSDELFAKSAEVDSTGYSDYKLAEFYQNSNRTDKILYWAQQAWKKGYHDPKIFLLLTSGFYVANELDSCEYYLNQAAKNGIPQAKDLLKELKMSKW